MVNKSYKMLGFINRNTNDFNYITCLKTLYYSLVRSILEFGSLIWSSDYSTYKSDLDNLQFKFLKRIAHVICYNLSHCSVKHLQDSIEVHYLEVRRNLADIMFIFDILNGFVICPEILALINFRIPRKSTRNLDLFKIPFYKTNIGTNSFLPRVLFLANIISATLDFFNMSRYTFKANTLIILNNNIIF